MRNTRIIAVILIGLVGALSVPACNLDVPDLNNPGLEDLQNNPNAASVGAAATGLLIGSRRNHAAANGYVSQLGILGRESYNLDLADPRYVNEMLRGPLDQGSPFGGNFWAGPYANIKLGNLVLHAADKVNELTAAQKAAVRGFVKTINAIDLLEVIATHDSNGGVVDTDHDLGAPLGAIVDKTAVYSAIVSQLDSGLTDLAAGGMAFPFLMSEGYAGFDTPATFAKFNRAIKARVAAYIKDYAAVNAALAASFLDDGAMADFEAGVYYTYSTKAGDTTNALLNPNIYAHPSLATDVQKNGATNDARFTAKIEPASKPGSLQGATSNIVFTMYQAPDSRVSLIRNEELILLKAEALFYTGNVPGALAELNIVRTRSGGLLPLAGTPNEATFLDELLYERRYSLMFEGHRWIDLRRFNRMLPVDLRDDARNVRYPIPLPECNARTNEPRCALGST